MEDLIQATLKITGPHGFYVAGMGKKTICALVESGDVKKPYDVFNLSVEQVKKFVRIGPYGAKKQWTIIQRAKVANIRQFLLYIGITGLGNKDIAPLFDGLLTLDEVFELIDHEYHNPFHGLSRPMCNKIWNYLKDPEVRKHYEELKAAGIVIVNSDYEPPYRKQINVEGVLEPDEQLVLDKLVKTKKVVITRNLVSSSHICTISMYDESALINKSKYLGVPVYTPKRFVRELAPRLAIE